MIHIMFENEQNCIGITEFINVCYNLFSRGL